jgi:DNA polymerase III alpha subunit
MWKVYAYHFGKKEGLLPPVRPHGPLKLIDWELKNLDGAASFPEWALYKEHLRENGRVKGCDLGHHIGKEVLLFGLYVTGKKVWTKNDEPMCFATFSDETALVETVFFPTAYLLFRDLLGLEKAFMIRGRVEETLGSVQVNVSNLSAVVPSINPHSDKKMVTRDMDNGPGSMPLKTPKNWGNSK